MERWKPDLVAVGGNENSVSFTGSMYLATQSYDPLGDMYSADGYANADGTSFSTPLVAGAAALVKQHHPQFTAAEIKSALVNTASNTINGDAAIPPMCAGWEADCSRRRTPSPPQSPALPARFRSA